jgi:hypothetical protein
VISNVAFSPVFMVVTPSSQPKMYHDQPLSLYFVESSCSRFGEIVGLLRGTFDDLTDTDSGLEVATTDGAVEPACRQH